MEKKNRNNIISIIATIVIGLSVTFITPLLKGKTDYAYHTKEFDFNLEDAEGEYANFYLSLGANSYPSKQPWMQVHMACLKNDIRKKPRFLGVGNTLCIGTIWQKDFISMRTTMDSLHFDEKTIQRFTKRGKVSSCGTSVNVNISAGVLLNVTPTYFDQVNGELGFLLRKPKRTSVTVESFVPVDLLTGDLIACLDTCSDGQCQQYLRWFSEVGNLISTWAYEVNGVSILVETQDTMSASLKAKLQTDLQSSPINGKLQTDFKYIDNRTIKITTHNSFYCIGGIQRIANVKERKKK